MRMTQRKCNIPLSASSARRLRRLPPFSQGEVKDRPPRGPCKARQSPEWKMPRVFRSGLIGPRSSERGRAAGDRRLPYGPAGMSGSSPFRSAVVPFSSLFARKTPFFAYTPCKNRFPARLSSTRFFRVFCPAFCLPGRSFPRGRQPGSPLLPGRPAPRRRLSF